MAETEPASGLGGSACGRLRAQVSSPVRVRLSAPSADPSLLPGERRASAPAPLGPGGGRPLSPGRASEHVQSRAPASPLPAARSAPPASSAPARPHSAPAPPPGLRARKAAPGALGVRGLATGAGGARAAGTAGLQARRPGRRACGRRCGRPAGRDHWVSPVSWVPWPGPLLRAASWIPSDAGKQVCADAAGSAARLHLLGLRAGALGAP